MNEQYKRIVKALLETYAAESDTHQRIQNELSKWAIQKGYSEKHTTLPNGQRPDVLRTDSEDNLVFIGDAKNADNETSRNSATVSRIYSYMSQFSNLVAGSYNGGTFAIATNSHEEALNWRSSLNLMAALYSLVDANGRQPDFAVEKLSEHTWVVFW